MRRETSSSKIADSAVDPAARLERAESELALNTQLLARVQQAIISILPDGRVASWNRHAEMLYGWTDDEAIGRPVAELLFPSPDVGDAARLTILRLLAGHPVCGERQLRRKSGELIWVSLSAAPIFDSQGHITHIVGTSVDVTERKRLEQRLRQSQKMEAVGRLAGGVAHDFNNLLTVINGHAEFLSHALPAEGDSRMDIDQISKAAKRAAALTKQLLALSRQQVMEKRIVDPNGLLRDLEKLLGRVGGNEVSIQLALDPHAPLVLADPAQLEQALITLVVNARDAMPDGGSIRLSTQPVNVCAAEAARRAEAQPGDYAAITVADTGRGIAPEHIGRIFEPFFTTRLSGRGTGLGLATVYGIAQQSGGFADVTSEAGKGSSFTLYFPAAPADDAPGPGDAPGLLRPGDEVILLVEDQDDVRAVARRILLTHGYRVLEAHNGAEALSLLAESATSVDLVLTDAVMPQMNGADFVRAMRRRWPGIPAVMISGYTDQQLGTYGTRELNLPFVSKPFRADDLLRVLRKTLDEAGAARAT